MVTWTEIDDFTEDIEKLDMIDIANDFKTIMTRICDEGLEDEHGKILLVKYTETFENIHALIMAGHYEDACRMFERFFHYTIGSGVPPEGY